MYEMLKLITLCVVFHFHKCKVAVCMPNIRIIDVDLKRFYDSLSSKGSLQGEPFIACNKACLLILEYVVICIHICIVVDVLYMYPFICYVSPVYLYVRKRLFRLLYKVLTEISKNVK